MRVMFVLQFYTKMRINTWALSTESIPGFSPVVFIGGVQLGPVGLSVEVLREGRLG